MKSKLVKCKTCGAEIAKNAKKCPNCGAPQHQVALTIAALLSVFAVFCIFIIIIEATKSGSMSPSGSSASKQDSEAVQTSATDLWNAYKDNEVNADNLYKDKLLAVTGTISDIGKDIITKNPCVSFKVGDQLEFYSVQCFFPDSEEKSSTLAALKDGQKITIYGTCKGTPITNVQLSDCYLSD